jgi:hypothetical protein
MTRKKHKAESDDVDSDTDFDEADLHADFDDVDSRSEVLF